LPFDLAQGGESFDSVQDREPVDRLVEPFEPALARLDRHKPSTVANFRLVLINTIGVNPVWARDLFFGAWNFYDFDKRVTLLIPSN
jgi:hypothetical protein